MILANFYTSLYWSYSIFSAVSVGMMLMVGALNVFAFFKLNCKLNSIPVYRALLSLGYALTIGTLLYATRSEAAAGIPPTPEYWIFMVGLTLSALGACGLALKGVHLYVELDAEAFEDKYQRSQDEQAKATEASAS